jgi:large subunit ribosomal protein L29
LKSSEIRNMTVAEIENQLSVLKEQLFKMRVESTSGRLERPGRFRTLKKDVARCHTILKEKKGESNQTA